MSNLMNMGILLSRYCQIAFQSNCIALDSHQQCVRAFVGFLFLNLVFMYHELCVLSGVLFYRQVRRHSPQRYCLLNSLFFLP